MGDNDHGAARFCQRQNHIQHFPHHFRIEGRGDLVQQQDFRVHTHRTDDGHPLLLSAGQLPGIVVLPVGKPHPFQQLQRFFFHIAAGVLLHLHGREQDVF